MADSFETKQQKKWEAEDDARTLARAIAIMQEKGRIEAAQKAAKKLLKKQEEYAREAEKERKAMAQLSEGKFDNYSPDFQKQYGGKK